MTAKCGVQTGRLGPVWVTAAVALVAFCTCLASGGAARATAGEPTFKWLCHPGIPAKENPCLSSLRTEVVGPDGKVGSYTPRRLKKPPVDCFYVYPTVSGQPTEFADLSADGAVRGVTLQQAARFSSLCRVFAPVYRQRTIVGLASGIGSASGWETAYAGVEDAFSRYLEKSNRGRGIVLIGHSQGTRHLSELVARTFDQRPGLRRKLVSALLIGGNFNVRTGSTTGGTLDNIPTCSRAGQFGCVIAYSGFLSKPPDNAVFGHVSGALAPEGDATGLSVACVNPARLDGSQGALRPLYNTKPLDAVYGALLPSFPKPSAPWVTYPNLYRASCQTEGALTWLQVDDVSTRPDDRFRVQEPLGRTWGTHLTEVNDAAGNLLGVVARQSRAWLAKRSGEKGRGR